MLLVRLQQISGILIVLLILLDVFLTVLYARMGSGLISPQLARTVWRAFRVVARSFPRHCDRIASFCGPVILVSLVFVWIAGLTLGNALLFHPVLGSAIRSSSGKTPTDFVSALYAGGSSISIVGSADFSPYCFALPAGLPVQLHRWTFCDVADADLPDADLQSVATEEHVCP